MAAKNADPFGDGTVDAISWEGGAQDWIRDCGNCHVGGGQAEYDRDMDDYASSDNTGDKFVFKQPKADNPATTTIDESNPVQVTAGFMGGANKGEVDCLICHMDGSVSGQYWMVSRGCNGSNPMGPRNDKNCDGAPDAAMYAGLPVVDPPAQGTAYDMHNRNLAIKGELLQYGPALGIGAEAVRNCTGTSTPCRDNSDCSGKPVQTCDLVGISWDWTGTGWDNDLGAVPTILGSKIAYTPNSANCSVCHGRDDNTIALPGQTGMKFGYGNYFIWEKPGTMLDADTVSKTNDVVFFELGCKTGMGKRGSRAGQGANDRWGMSMFNAMFNLGNGPGTPIEGETLSTMMGPITVKERIPDIDIHEMSGQNLGYGDHDAAMKCGDCHYTVGSVDLDSAARRGDSFTGTGEVTMTGGKFRGNDYLAEPVRGIDHLFAKGDVSPDGNSKDNLDGTVTCESCHIYMNHPKLTKVGADYKINGKIAPQPDHAGLPAFHLDKIGCTTCHIPETYAAPARKKYRDWTAGLYKGSFRNMLEWNYDLVTGSHVPFPMTWKWQTKYGEKKIYPFLPSLDPMWYETLTDSRMEDGSEAGLMNPIPDATASSAPIKARLAYRAANALMKDGTKNPGNVFDIRLNHGDGIPLFDGFQMSDSWEIDNKAEIDAMVATFADSTKMLGETARIKNLNIVEKDFDVAHGVVPKEWALGGTKRGGCVSCHSSSQPYKVDYTCVDLNHGNGVSATEGMACNPYAMNMDCNAMGTAEGTCSPNVAANPAYNPNSIGLFEGAIQPLNRGTSFMAAMNGKQGYDYVRNWFALFADFDCTKMTNYMHMSQGMCDMMCRTQMGMPAEMCAQACMPNASFKSMTDPDGAGPIAGQDLYMVDDGGNLFATMCMMTSNQIDPTNCAGIPAGTAMPTALYGAMATPGGPETAMVPTPLGVSAPFYTDNAYFGAGYGYSGMPAVDMSVLGTNSNPNCAGLEAGSCDMFLHMCVNMMTATFDDVMGFPKGIAAMMGMWDGVAGLQGFTVKENTAGLHQGCNPFAGSAMGPVSQAFGMGENVNLCYDSSHNGACSGPMPAGMTSGFVPGDCGTGGTCESVNNMYGQACTADAQCNGMAPAAGNPMAYTATCAGGFAAGHLCWMNADCEGSMAVTIPGTTYADTTTMVMPRDMVRTHYKIELQQSAGGTAGYPLSGTPRVSWLLKGESNPGNPDHDMIDGHEDGKIKADQALNCVDMFNQPTTCSEGSNINIIVPSNFWLGYKTQRLADLMWGSNVAPEQDIPDVTPGDGDPTTSDFTNTVHCVDIDRDFECDDLDGDGVGDELPIASNLTLNPRMSVTASYKRDSNGDIVPDVDKGIALDYSRSLCDNTPCTYAWSFTNASGMPVAPAAMPAPVNGKTIATMTAAGTYNVTLTITDSQGNVAWKTLQATAEDKNDAPTLTSVTAGVVGSTVTLTVVASDDAGVTSVFVDWNDGTSNTYPSASGISHNYSTTTGSGDYSIGVVVLDAKGLRTDARVNVTIQ